MGRLVLGSVVFAALLLVLGFIAVPLIAIFAHVSPGSLVDQLGNPVVRDALLVSAKTSLVAQAAILLLGTPAAYVLARRRFAGRSLLITLIELPMVLPPAVAGIALLVGFGRLGLLGGALNTLGINVAFDQLAVILAVAFVAGPLYVRTAIASFAAIDSDQLAASRTLGAGSLRTFMRIALPLAGGGLAAGLALSLARGLGEFGATIMFAGSLPRVTQTLPLAIYAEFDSNLGVAVTISALFVVIAAALLLTIKVAARWQPPSRLGSRFLAARSS